MSSHEGEGGAQELAATGDVAGAVELVVRHQQAAHGKLARRAGVRGRRGGEPLSEGEGQRLGRRLGRRVQAGLEYGDVVGQRRRVHGEMMPKNGRPRELPM